MNDAPGAFAAADGGHRGPPGPPVRVIRQQRVAQVARVHADLVCAPRAQPPRSPSGRAVRQRLDHPVAADSVAAPAPSNTYLHHFLCNAFFNPSSTLYPKPTSEFFYY